MYNTVIVVIIVLINITMMMMMTTIPSGKRLQKTMERSTIFNR